MHSVFESGEMYAIVNISGRQFKVSKDDEIFAPLQSGNAGDKVEFEEVLLLDDKGKVQLGSPTIKGAKVSGKILDHIKGDKTIVFKKKRRKGYKVKNGHRQGFTKVQIDKISK